MAACRAEALSKVYGRRDTAVHALRDITLSIPSHAFTAIMGPSGSGKSTLLHCLAALDTPTSGRVYLGQTELTSLSRRQQAQVRRDRIGFVFQAFNLVPTLDAIENITLPQLLAGRRPNREWLEYVVARIGLADRLHHRPSQLSGGQQQRVALGRALAGQPEVIFADEPTGNLDTRASREMMSLLRSAVDDFRQTVVTVTHDPAIAGYADQVLFFTDGQVVDQVVHPEPDLVLEHLQYLDFSAPAHRGSRGQLHASMQPNGQDMRSRRRRRGDETGPGRPMVGSDDEVEVARQERWLERIREQFEAEHEAAHARDEYHDAYDTGSGYPDTTQHTTNGYPDTNHTANGYQPDATHLAANGYQPDTAHLAPNGYQPDTAHLAPNGYQPDATHLAANGYHPDTAYHTANGQVSTQAFDDGWLPPERSWLSDAAAAAGGGTGAQHDTGQHASVDQTWSQPAPAADAQPAHSRSVAPEDDHRWSTSSWDAPQPDPYEQPHADTARRDAWTTEDPYADSDGDRWRSRVHPADPAATASPVTPIESWRESRAQEPAHDGWSAPQAEGEWSTITPSEPAAGQWDTPAAPERGWQSQPSGPANHAPEPAARETFGQQSEPVQPSSANGDGGWQQRWQPDHHVPDTASPVRNGQYHDDVYDSQPPPGSHEASRNGRHPTIADHEADPHNSEPLHAPRRQRASQDTARWQAGEPAVEVREIRPDEPSPNGGQAPQDNRSDAPNQQREIVDPVRELLDIWSPGGAGDKGWSPEQPPAADNGDFGGLPQEPAGSFESAPVQRGAAAEPYPHADEWHTDAGVPAHHDDPYAPRPSQSYSGITTDPFEALQSLQSQLNRLGGGRRAPRRYEE
jgi:putative ABC transport system ATP-binding protein